AWPANRAATSASTNTRPAPPASSSACPWTASPPPAAPSPDFSPPELALLRLLPPAIDPSEFSLAPRPDPRRQSRLLTTTARGGPRHGGTTGRAGAAPGARRGYLFPVLSLPAGVRRRPQFPAGAAAGQSGAQEHQLRPEKRQGRRLRPAVGSAGGTATKPVG